MVKDGLRRWGPLALFLLLGLLGAALLALFNVSDPRTIVQREAIKRLTSGSALLKEGKLDGAIAEYRAALRLTPNDAKAHTQMAFALLNKGDFEGAVAECRVALRLAPDHAEAHINLGIALYGKKDFDGAIAAFREGLRLNPSLAIVHYDLGRVFEDRGDAATAADEFETYIRLTPDTPSDRPRIDDASNRITVLRVPE